MLSVVSFLAFLIYSALIFFVKESYLLLGVLLINLCLMLILKINLRRAIIFIIKLLPFIIFTGILNIIFGGIGLGILISVRLILVCNITFIFSQKMTPSKIAYCIEKLLTPLKIIKINPREIGIMVSIAISFIPIMQKEIQNLKYSLTAKGFKINFRNSIRRPNVILVPLITSIIKKVEEIEQSMISKGYNS